MELTEPTRANLLAGVDRVLAHGHGYRFLVGTTRWGTQLLQEDPEEPLPLAEMIPISSSRHVRIWWSMNPANEPMNLLFCAHRATDIEEGTPLPGSTNFAPRNNCGTPPDESAGSDNDENLDDENQDDDDGNQPESSATAVKRTTTTRTTMTTQMRNAMRMAGQIRGSCNDLA